jgi:hypothetical protein
MGPVFTLAHRLGRQTFSGSREFFLAAGFSLTEIEGDGADLGGGRSRFLSFIGFNLPDRPDFVTPDKIHSDWLNDAYRLGLPLA